jgi:hypothetical protein
MSDSARQLAAAIDTMRSDPAAPAGDPNQPGTPAHAYVTRELTERAIDELRELRQDQRRAWLVVVGAAIAAVLERIL